MHADHTEGLGNDWAGGTIHCSTLTAQLLRVSYFGTKLGLSPSSRVVINQRRSILVVT